MSWMVAFCFINPILGFNEKILGYYLVSQKKNERNLKIDFHSSVESSYEENNL